MDLEDGDGLLDLALEGLLVLQHVDQLGVVDLQEHAGDLAGQLGVHALDEGEEALAQHLLLLLWRSRRKHRSCQRLLALDQHGRLGLLQLWGHRLGHGSYLGWVPHTCNSKQDLVITLFLNWIVRS